MKYYSKILSLAVAFAGLTSCAIDEVKEFPVEKPEHLDQYVYLSEYDVLKSYVDRNAYPNFKLGAGVTASKFVQHGQEYVMAVSNFDEVTPGNAMKHASVVGNKGTMNLDPVRSFVDDALNAGLSVYGHTLAWHSQQNNKFLNSLIADKIDPNYTPQYEEKVVTKPGTCIEVVSQDMVSAAWDTQFFIKLPNPVKGGDSWEVSMDVLALNEAGPGTQFHVAPGEYLHWNAIGNVQFTTEWTTWTNKGTVDAEADGCYTIAFNINDYAPANTYYFDNISVLVNGVEQITNGNCDDPSGTANFYSKEYPSGDIVSSRIVSEYKQFMRVEVPNTETVTKTCLIVDSPAKVVQDWDSQFWFVFDEKDAFKEGDTYELTMEIRADVAASVATQTHKAPGDYLDWMGVGTVNFTTEWTEVVLTGTFTQTDYSNPIGAYSIAFNLTGADDNKFYFDNISFKLNGEEKIENGNCDDPAGTKNFVAKSYPAAGGTSLAPVEYTYTIELPGGRTPLTPEEKKENLTKAMDDWIKGMMSVTAGKVKTWDAVNEAISGVDNDGDGKYDLQSAENGDPDNNFYWQDYLGNEDYVRFVVGKAREYYEEYGGNPAELKLFINDYNLESWWDGNKKLQSLLDWIEVWESDGETVIDGIGTQMHVSYILNEDDQKAQENAIVNMFTMLAESGKLVKISELDMGIVENAFGAGIAATAVTEEQHQKMAQFYQFIVSKYLEIIPPAKQYGITQWCTSDPGGSLGSGWRGGEPVGLWDVNYARKHTYAGFVEGLKGTK